ncbi:MULTISPECIES: rhamnan synthesis F family protein [Pantoea]|uniref:rhamnan synthesis F family protein n=1 Tax=Pantoea TaxID=53335 RepID=UPI00073FEBD4|nr:MULTISPECIES: rhamnan synthesis F family protein [Pantoea]
MNSSQKSFDSSIDTFSDLQIISEDNTQFPNYSLNAISFMSPVELTLSAWLEHIPFAFWLINAHKPRVLVELGTHYGSSYFAFCQAINQLNLPTKTYAVDMWKGDEHAGFYGENVFSAVQSHNNHLYSRFSTLMRTSFDEASEHFSDDEIDLLHIDGYHTYEAVKNDFDVWLPKLSNRGVVIIHDSNVRKADFGVYKFVSELRKLYPCFEFSHGHGLTIVGVGSEQTAAMIQLFSSDNNSNKVRHIQSIFSKLGKACSDEYKVKKNSIEMAHQQLELKDATDKIKYLKNKNNDSELTLSNLRERIDIHLNEIETLRSDLRYLQENHSSNNKSLLIKEHELHAVLNSTSWRVTKPLRFFKRLVSYLVRKARLHFFNNKKITAGNRQALKEEVVDFDSEWYLTTYPDIADSGIDPYQHYLEHGRDEGRYSSEQALKKALAPDLDEEWYLNTYSDVKSAGLSALHHYTSYGRIEGRFSSLARLFAQDFDEKWYVEQYPDVAGAGIEPLEHFLLHGYAEGRKPCAMPRMLEAPYFRYGPSEYGAKDAPLLIDSDVCLNKSFSQRIAVHLHLYYIDLADEFINYLDNIPVKFDLFISIPEGKYNVEDCESLFTSSLKLLNKITVKETKNVGRDIYPFVVEFGKELLSYGLILHIHSKKSPQSKTRGWRRFLLHYTLGSRAIITQILNAFDDDQRLGAFFPAYFHATTRQPLWGGNSSIVEKQLENLGFEYDMTYCPDYPAGSFFWARPEAYRPILDGKYQLGDFDQEEGQFDGTLAHGFERLFGVLPLLQNYTTRISFVDRDYRLLNYFDKERFAKLEKNTLTHFEEDRNADILIYEKAISERVEKKAKVALVTAIIGDFDALFLPKYLEGDVDYHCFSDTVSDGYGVFQVHKPPYVDADPRRTARYIKTNLLKYVEGYDYIVWIDANVEINVRVTELVQRVSSSSHTLGAIQHPVRDNLFEESEEIISWKLDDESVVREQTARYESIHNLRSAPLIESNVLVMDARDEKIHNFMRLWWNEINNYSRRDQLSIGYALEEANVTWQPLLAEQQSTRDSHEFALFRHGINDWGPKPHIYSSWYNCAPKKTHDINLINSINVDGEKLNLDIVVCIHNALEDVRACLDSLADMLSKANIILVDDASDIETKQFLEEYAEKNSVTLLRQNQRLGYTKTSNNGIRSGNNQNVLLLNSDTIVPPGSLSKLCFVLNNQPNLGVVGPLSNAASTQSVPSIKGSAGQTAINSLPGKLSPAELDLHFEKNWDQELVRVPLVHGFCFMVKRTVFEKVGLFDEQSFPHGYGEENDFCFRVADAGFDLAVLTNTYIYHAKSKSYASDERVRLMDDGMKALVRKYSVQRIQRSVSTMQHQPKLEVARALAQNLYDQYEVK